MIGLGCMGWSGHENYRFAQGVSQELEEGFLTAKYANHPPEITTLKPNWYVHTVNSVNFTVNRT